MVDFLGNLLEKLRNGMFKLKISSSGNGVLLVNFGCLT